MEQSAGNARTEVQTALRKSRVARLHRRIAWCDGQIAMLLGQLHDLTQDEARRGLAVLEQRRVLRRALQEAA